MKIQDAQKFEKDFDQIDQMIKVFGEDSNNNLKEINKVLVFKDKFQVEFIIDVKRNFKNHLYVEVTNPIKAYM